MAVPVLKLNLAPPSNFWRMNHGPVSWMALVLGGLILAGSLGFTWGAYQHAATAGKLAVSLSTKTQSTADAQARILADLRNVDVAKELPRWRLAERIYTERSLPWSRLTAELERSMVQDVRVKSLQRNRSADQRVQLKLKGEARSREAEAAFVRSLQKNPFFEQVIFEREGERQGGGVEFDYTLAVATLPPPYQPLPRYGPQTRGKVAVVPPPMARPAAMPAAAGRPGASQYRGIAVPPEPARSSAPVPARPAAPRPRPAFPAPPFQTMPGRPLPDPGQAGPSLNGNLPGRPMGQPRRPMAQESDQ